MAAILLTWRRAANSAASRSASGSLFETRRFEAVDFKRPLEPLAAMCGEPVNSASDAEYLDDRQNSSQLQGRVGVTGDDTGLPEGQDWT
jgi:hypothetical protein